MARFGITALAPIVMAHCLAVAVNILLAPGAAVASPLTDKGTQPLSLSHTLLTPGDCGSCHGDYEPASNHEPYPTWAGSMMANASRDPLFWAALDVANNDLPGSGDFFPTQSRGEILYDMWDTHGKSAPEDVASASDAVPLPEPNGVLALAAGVGMLWILSSRRRR